MKAMKAAAPKAMKAVKAMKAMKVVKGMKAVKAMKAAAPKAMKAMKTAMKKVISAKLAKRHAFAGKIAKSKGGLVKSDLTKNKQGKVVSKKTSQRAKASPWMVALAKARAALKIKGFCAIKKGTPFYNKAKELYGK